MRSEARVLAWYYLHYTDHPLSLLKNLLSLCLAASHGSLQQHVVKAAGPTGTLQEINPFSSDNLNYFLTTSKEFYYSLRMSNVTELFNKYF